jgi:GTPase
LVDATGENPVAAYETIQAELHAYGHELDQRPQILALNKIDAVEPEVLEEIAQHLHNLTGSPVFQVSAVAQMGLDELLGEVWQTLDQMASSSSIGSD